MLTSVIDFASIFSMQDAASDTQPQSERDLPSSSDDSLGNETQQGSPDSSMESLLREYLVADLLQSTSTSGAEDTS